MGSCNGGGHDCQLRKPLKQRIRHFTPAWHTVNMGTGAVSLLFHLFPYGNDAQALQYVALTFHLFNFVLFMAITVCAIARYVLFRQIWISMLHHPVQSLFIGSFPMALATLINASVGIIYIRFNFGGPTFLYALWGIWWFDVALSVIICFGQLHLMSTRHTHSIGAMTTVWLLPVVTLIVASSTGGVIAESLQVFSPSHALLTLAVSFVIVVIGVTVAMMMLTIYLHRLIVYGIPVGITIYSAFLPLGPMGQAGYSFMLMGQIVEDLLPLHSGASLLTDPMTPRIINVICFCVGFMLWSLATAWLILAVLALSETLLRNRVPFKLTFWGMIFPNGVYANLTLQLASTLDSSFFRVWGTIYAGFTLLLWTYAVMRTVPSVWNGEIFQAPCLDDEAMDDPLLHRESHGLPSDTKTTIV